MIINNKKQHAVSTVIQSRYPFFLPTKNVSQKTKDDPIDVEIETKNGTLIIKGCLLTQVHRNIVDCIFSFYEPHPQLDGSVVFMFSRYELLEHLGYKSRKNTGWLESKFEEMRKALIQLKEHKELKGDEVHQKISFRGVLTGYDVTKIESPNKKDAFLYGVIFSESFMRAFDEDVNIYSQEVTHDIIALKNGLTQAFVREVISHSNSVNSPLEDVLEKLGVVKDNPRGFNKKIKPLLDNRKELKDVFGIDIRKMKSRPKDWGVFYTQHKDVFFKAPINLSKNRIN